MSQRLRGTGRGIGAMAAMIHCIGYPGHGELRPIKELGSIPACACLLLIRRTELKFDPCALTFLKCKRAEGRIPKAGLSARIVYSPLSRRA